MNDPALQGYTKIGEGAWYKETPAYANGGIVTSPQLAMVGEAGPEAIIPLSQLGSGEQIINLFIDGEQVTNVIERRMNNRVRLQEVTGY
jgi:SLT domain-containing protein